jgi:hypothetical protein
MLTDGEVRLLKHYSERERVIKGLQRTAEHQRLLALGYINEEHLNMQDLRITVTDTGRALLRG